MTSVLKNLQSLFHLCASFPGCRVSSNRSGGVTLFDSGTASAYENYALIDPMAVCLASDDVTDEMLDFFGAQPHIWPLFPGLEPQFGPVLKAHGAVCDDRYFDMSARTDAMRGGESPVDSLEVASVFDPRWARAWADAVWYGFDSGEPAPDSFMQFSDALIRHPKIHLVAVRAPRADVPFFSATGMLACAEGSAGIYYIATRPEYRRRGLAARVMNALLLAADARGYDCVSLLATPSGRPLYETCGFVATGDVEIYRFGDA